MFCKKCSSELKEDEKFCGKCGQKVNGKAKPKLKGLIISISIFILLIGGIAGGLYFYGDNIQIGDITIKNPMTEVGITNEYLINNFKKNGFNQFDDMDVKILAITDIQYNDFNKVALVNRTVTNQGVKISQTGILLINRKDDKVEGFTINNNLMFLLSGICNNNYSKTENITKICARNIQDNGTEIFNSEDTEFKNLVKEISNTVDISQARKYVKTEFQKTVSNDLNETLLFEKDSALVKYIAFYEQSLKYNTNYPINENTYKYFQKDYSNRQTLNTLEYVYGPAYSTVYQYEIRSVSNADNGKVVGTYQSLEGAKSALYVEE